MMKKSTLLCLAFIMGVSGICAHAEEKKEEKAVMQEMILEYDGGVHKYKGSVYALKVNGKKFTGKKLEVLSGNYRIETK